MTETGEKITNYIDSTIKMLSDLKNQADEIETIHTTLKNCIENGDRIFLFGNGGSSSTASHIVCDLNKTSTRKLPKKAKAFALNDNNPSVFAISNDIGFDFVFEEQLKNFLEPNDVVIALSGSGNSTNVINAVNYAKELGSTVIGFTGFDGGKLRNICDYCLIVPSDKMFHVEDGHLILNHILTYLFTGYSYE